MKRHFWLVAAAFVNIATPFEQLSAQTTKNLPKCDAKQVEHRAFDTSFADRVVVRKTRNSDLPVTTDAKKFSPQKTRWVVVKEPNFMKPGPWTTTVLVSGVNPDSSSSELSLIDHASGGAQAEWLNEKLLFIRVWWGRIVSTDLILNVEEMTFPYREMADYGDFIQPCE